MNFTKSLKRNNFVEVDCFSSQISSSHQPRSRCGRDPFEGDPFKIQSLNFHYADKPSYPISNRGKGLAGVDKSQVKNIYYNHDHTIPKCNKENLPLGHSRQSQQFNPVRKSSSFRSVSVASKTFSTDKACLESNSMSQQISALSRSQHSSTNSRTQQPREDSHESLSLNRARSSLGPREVQPHRSKPCICIPNMITKTSSTNQSKMYSKPTICQQSTTSNLSSASAPVVVHKRTVKSRSDVSEQLTDIDVNHTGSCHVTIKINGVPKNRVHISKNRNNVEINLTKPKRSKKQPKSPKALSPHALKPSKSYVIHRDEPTPSRNTEYSRNTNYSRTDFTRNSELSRNDMKDSSTLSMVPHREEKQQHPPLETRQASSIPTISDTIRAYTGLRSGSASRTSIPARNNFEKHAAMLEKILSNNPIVLQPKGRILFTRSKPPLSRKCSSTAMPSSYVFDKMNSQAC